MRRSSPGRELIDDGRASPEQVAGNLRDMERMLRVLGVGRRTLGFLAELISPADRSLRLLDLASGSGWLSRLVAGWGAARGVRIEITSVDVGPAVVRAARHTTPKDLPVAFVRGDALHLPFGTKSFDAVLCTMALHHFDPPAAVRLLRTIDETAGRGWFICDLLRSRLAWVVAMAATRLLSANPLTRHDGPLSARRAHTLGELRALVSTAGPASVQAIRFSGVCGALWKVDNR